MLFLKPSFVDRVPWRRLYMRSTIQLDWIGQRYVSFLFIFRFLYHENLREADHAGHSEYICPLCMTKFGNLVILEPWTPSGTRRKVSARMHGVSNKRLIEGSRKIKPRRAIDCEPRSTGRQEVCWDDPSQLRVRGRKRSYKIRLSR